MADAGRPEDFAGTSVAENRGGEFGGEFPVSAQFLQRHRFFSAEWNDFISGTAGCKQQRFWQLIRIEKGGFQREVIRQAIFEREKQKIVIPFDPGFTAPAPDAIRLCRHSAPAGPEPVAAKFEKNVSSKIDQSFFR